MTFSQSTMVQEIWEQQQGKRVTASFLEGHRRHPDHINRSEEADMAATTMPHMGTIREGAIITLNMGSKMGWARCRTNNGNRPNNNNRADALAVQHHSMTDAEVMP